MTQWNWQFAEWPRFTYDPKSISTQEKQFLLNSGSSGAFIKNIAEEDYHQFIVEILSEEG